MKTQSYYSPADALADGVQYGQPCRARQYPQLRRRTDLELPGVKWIFLDVGSTLVNEDDAVEDRLLKLQSELEDSGIPVSLEEFRTLLQDAICKQTPKAASFVIDNLADSEALRSRLKASMAWRDGLVKPYPEARRVLNALHKTYRIGIIANQPPGTEARLKAWGLWQYISLCLPSAETGLSKPDLAIFELAMQKSSCKPEHAVMVGDRIDNDVTPGNSLGWKTIRVKQGLFQAQVPMSPQQVPDFEVQRLQDVPNILL